MVAARNGQKSSKSKKRRVRKKRPADPRTSSIVPKAGPVKITKADGTVVIEKPMPATKYRDKPYPTVRPRKAL